MDRGLKRALSYFDERELDRVMTPRLQYDKRTNTLYVMQGNEPRLEFHDVEEYNLHQERGKPPMLYVRYMGQSIRPEGASAQEAILDVLQGSWFDGEGNLISFNSAEQRGSAGVVSFRFNQPGSDKLAEFDYDDLNNLH